MRAACSRRFARRYSRLARRRLAERAVLMIAVNLVLIRFLSAPSAVLSILQADYSCEFVFIRGLKSGLLSVLPA